MALQDEINNGVIYALESLKPDLNLIYEECHGLVLDEYIDNQRIKTLAIGIGTSVIPGMHLVGMAADIVALFKILSNAVYGIGSIKMHESNIGVTGLGEDDFIVVLANWSGDSEAMAAAQNAINISAEVVASNVATKVVLAAMPQTVTKLIAMAVSKKIGLKLSTKVISGFIPFLGPAVSAGINGYIFSSIAEEAQKYYKTKIKTLATQKA